MASADEHLGQIVGATISNLLFQIAMLRAEVDRLKFAEQGRDGRVPERVPVS